MSAGTALGVEATHNSEARSFGHSSLSYPSGAAATLADPDEQGAVPFPQPALFAAPRLPRPRTGPLDGVPPSPSGSPGHTQGRVACADTVSRAVRQSRWQGARVFELMNRRLSSLPRVREAASAHMDDPFNPTRPKAPQTTRQAVDSLQPRIDAVATWFQQPLRRLIRQPQVGTKRDENLEGRCCGSGRETEARGRRRCW